MKLREELRRHFQSYCYAAHGIAQVLRRQRNLWIQLIIGALALLAGIYFRLSATEFVLLLLTIGAVIAAELFNTAFEALADSATKEFNPHIKAAKDIAAGAVLVAAIVAVIVGIILFGPNLLKIVRKL